MHRNVGSYHSFFLFHVFLNHFLYNYIRRLNVDKKDVHYDQGRNMGKDEVDDEATFQLKGY